MRFPIEGDRTNSNTFSYRRSSNKCKCIFAAEGGQTKPNAFSSVSVLQSKIKTNDFGAAVEICSILHQRYPEFDTLLMEALARVFANVKQAVAVCERGGKGVREGGASCGVG